MILVIDCGNTRVKWGLHAATPPRVQADGMDWADQGAAPLGGWEELDKAWSVLPAPSRIAIANVAGPEARAALSRLLARWSVVPLWTEATTAACGVSNGYADPAQLGADRWMALIAAWGRHRGASLVVNAGTATTIDTLFSDGSFRGGLILPGVELMKKALSLHTAALPLASGRYAEEPRNTADAIESGCLDAQTGAIERRYARLPQDAPCFLSGGAAGAVAARLNIASTIVDNLVLEGLLRLVL